MALSSEQIAIVGNRRRLWEVRKYCQVRPSLFVQDRQAAGHGRFAAHLTGAKGSCPDAASTALLRSLVLQLDVDVAMISLLDEHMQYFLAGAEKNIIDCAAEVTFESSKWYGCDRVAHHGGLCERTITLDVKQDPSAIYEELDIVENDWTKNLPLVNDAVAGFRQYAGAPIVTEAGLSIGTVFVINTKPSTRLIAAQRTYLTETASQVMRQLAQAVQALEGERMMRFHSASASLLHPRTSSPQLQTGTHEHSGTDRHLDPVLKFYRHAAETMRKCFDLDGVCFQNTLGTRQNAQTTYESQLGRILATSLKAGLDVSASLAVSDINRLVQSFPHGSIFYQLEGGRDGYFISASSKHLDCPSRDNIFAIGKTFQNARQVLFMPLFDKIHDTTAAVCVAWLDDHSRVYSERCDLSSMSAFCTSTISEVLRLKSHRLDQVKSDFLGSVSHEMRSPLHNTLGNLELLLRTSCSEEQRRLAVNARFGATQPLETIDKILQYAGVDCVRETTQCAGPAKHEDQVEDNILQIEAQDGHTSSATGTVDLITLCEEVVEDTAKRIRLLETIMSPTRYQEIDESTSALMPHAQPETADSDPFSIVLFDAKSTENLQLQESAALRSILENLLSNAIRHTRPDCCARVCLELSSSTVNLTVSDCGNGLSEDFLQHNLYVPFAQQDPVVSGIGLGLSITKQNVDELGGTINFETDQSLGTTATVTIQMESLASSVDRKVRRGGGKHNGTAAIPTLPKRPTEELPTLKAC